MKKLLEQWHLNWIRKIRQTTLNEIHEVADNLGNRYILRVMETSNQSVKMWQDLGKYQLPHLSNILGVSQGDGKCYVLEEKFPGNPLSEGTLNPMRLSHKDICWLGIGVARDLKVLFHEEGILHLDIKPENFLIDGHGNGRLIDFGAAITAIEKTNMLITPQLGTPKYMSPERYTDPNGIGPSADLYSLALTLKYAMMASDNRHFPLWQLLTNWGDPSWIQSIHHYQPEEWYALFILDLQEQMAT